VKTPLVSIILCTYNRPRMLERALTDLTCQEPEEKFSYEIVVVDDASTAETEQVIQKIASRSAAPVRYVREEGKGYSHALNRGLLESQGEWVAFFDDDQSTGPGWLRELMGVAVTKAADLVGGPIALEFEDSQLEKLGPVCRAICGETPNFRDRKKRHYKPLPGGGNSLVCRSVFDAIGGFDETMLTGGCDRDLVLRARAAGFRIDWAPGAIIQHAVTSEKVGSRQMKRYSLQAGAAKAYLDWKHSGLTRTILMAVARIARAVLIKIPELYFAFLVGNAFDMLDVRVIHWITQGYFRMTAFLVAPRLFSQPGFFVQTQFRELRQNAPQQL
jgi:glucosyl-dolichyl phosphate glucuronosyltransferase